MVKVLIVDDSSFFRRSIGRLLEPDPGISVVGFAVDGEDAIKKFQELKPDIITMDIEMPNMDGITALKEIMKIRPIPVLMFSTLTQEGAKVTLEALHAGAADFIPKNFQDVAVEKDELIARLRERIKTLGSQSQAKPDLTRQLRQTLQSKSIKKDGGPIIKLSNYKLIAIGASTGGPVALEKVLKKLPASFPSPIVLVQHMPESFTKAFAERLDKICNIHVKEAEDGDVLKPAMAFLAPGGKQTYVEKIAGQLKLKVRETPNLNYKPSVDETFRSIAKAYNKENILAIIMTGMGADGCEGSRQLKENGATIWAQDEATSVVYGMPMAVANENLADKILAVDDIGNSLSKSA